MYRVLSNIQDGAASLEYSLWNCDKFCSYDCDCGHFDYTCWAIQLRVRLARVQDTVMFADQPLGCHSRGVSVNDATHTVTTFPVSRLGVFLSGLQHSFPGISHNVLTDSGYKTPIQNMDETYASGIKLAYPTEYNFIVEIGDETEALKIHRNRVKCPSYFFVRNGQCIRRKFQFYSLIILLTKITLEFFMLARTLNP